MQTRNALTILVGVAVLTFVPASTSHAKKSPQKFTISITGTYVDIPLDLDADSCTTTGGVTVCTDFSAEFTSGGKGTGALGGRQHRPCCRGIRSRIRNRLHILGLIPADCRLYPHGY
jgi:hypothetical protein